MADESARDIALGNEILRGVIGSTAHGTAIAGSEDRDELGVFIEPPANVCGLVSCDHYVRRDRPDGVRSRPGDQELTSTVCGASAGWRREEIRQRSSSCGCRPT
jgi:hypothetical protein